MRRLCRFTAGFSIGCAACVAHFRSGAYLLAAIAAALCVLALGFRKQLHLQRLLPALLGLSLALREEMFGDDWGLSGSAASSD